MTAQTTAKDAIIAHLEAKIQADAPTLRLGVLVATLYDGSHKLCRLEPGKVSIISRHDLTPEELTHLG